MSFYEETLVSKRATRTSVLCVGSRPLVGVKLKIDFICIFGKSQCAFKWVWTGPTHLFFSCPVNCCKPYLCCWYQNFWSCSCFLNLSDQNEEADCWQEVQKGSFMEVHLGPDPPCGGRDPGLCKLCKSNCKSYCALSDRLYFNSEFW